MIDYSILYKSQLPTDQMWEFEPWDLFISAWRPGSERVTRPYLLAPAARKHWLIIPEYQCDSLPNEDSFVLEGINESEQICSYLDQANVDLSQAGSICVDITGFLKPQLLFLVMLMYRNGVTSFDAIYAEPYHYIHRSNTQFSGDTITEVRQVEGYAGIHDMAVTSDLMIIASGYDDRMISYAAESKNKARKVQIFGLPSLSPQMYQENLLRAHRASEAVGNVGINSARYAPANDPFVTANVLRRIVHDQTKRYGVRPSNLYLCPLSTMAQTLGFALYYIAECIDGPASVVLPFCDSYPALTGEGVQRIWRYTLELNVFRNA